MTEEKLAEKYVIDKYGTTAVSASAALQKAYIAGYKACYDCLMKNPFTSIPSIPFRKWHKTAYGDLPDDDREVLSDAGDIVRYDNETHSWFSLSNIEIDGVIAWCEIPKYEEE